MEVFYLNPEEVKVRGGLERFRKDLGAIEELAESIKRFGQLQPILVTEENELVCGGRRLAAAAHLGVKVLCVRKESLSDVELREQELEENLQRKNFTPAEECLAIAEIHEIKSRAAREEGSFKQWSLADTAALIGKTKGNVHEALELASLVKVFPELKAAETKLDIKRAGNSLKLLKTATERVEELKKGGAGGSGVEERILSLDAKIFLKGFKDETFDIFLTDPPFGIDATGTLRKETATGTFDDSADQFHSLLSWLPFELFRTTKPSSQGFIFFAPENYQPLIEAFSKAGWIPYPRPMVWAKPNAGQSNRPELYPSSSYEFALFLRKENSLLAKQGVRDFFSCNTLSTKAKLHPTEKPLAVANWLLDMIAIPGMSIVDPFMGSGTFLEASFRRGLVPFGTDINPECRTVSISRLLKAEEELRNAEEEKKGKGDVED